VVVARTPVHRRAFVPDQEIADLPSHETSGCSSWR
jgi:hypothetical protein